MKQQIHKIPYSRGVSETDMGCFTVEDEQVPETVNVKEYLEQHHEYATSPKTICESTTTRRTRNNREIHLSQKNISETLPVSLQSETFHFSRRNIRTQQGSRLRNEQNTSRIKINNRRQIQTVLDNSHENKTSFRLVTTPQGEQKLEGFINPSELSKHEQTQLLK